MDETQSDNEKYRRHLDAWKVAADVLARERIARLRAMTDADTRRAIVELFSAPKPAITVKSTSTS
jgi:hypothetical protein